jgi:ATPase family AAA domain-containing protein 3A/B
LGKPDLVRSSSRRGVFSDLSTWLRKDKGNGSEFKDVVLNESLFGHIQRLALATKSAHVSKLPLLNVMFYGEPGTGKTMVAKRFAEFSNLDYAIMSGGDVAPLGAEAVTEIHRLFKWVATSRRGVLLFIDEAESFLGQRTSGMSENLRNAITAFLFHTGTASSKFMLVIATNRPGDLDSAILDRIDERIEFPLPHVGERLRLANMYFERFVLVNGKDEIPEEQLKQTAKQTKGFSGREMSKLMMAVSTACRFGASGVCLSDVLKQVTDQKVEEHEKVHRMKKSGYQFDYSRLDSSGDEFVQPPTPRPATATN